MTQAATHRQSETDKIGTITTKWDLCDDRYVKWQSAAVWVLGGVTLIVGLSFAGGRWGAEMEARMTTFDARCSRIENMVQSVDTIKSDIKILLQESRK